MWQELPIPAEPAGLAVAPDGQTVLAGTAQGLLRSTDGGSTWSPVSGGPRLAVLSWSESGPVGGVDGAGRLWVSTDGGVTWQERAHLDGPPKAIHMGSDDGGGRVLVVTTAGLSESVDGGYAFQPLMTN